MEIWIHGNLNKWKIEFSDFWISGKLNFWIFEHLGNLSTFFNLFWKLEIWIHGNLNMWKLEYGIVLNDKKISNYDDLKVKKIFFRINQVRFTRIWRKIIFFNSSQLELKSDLARVETNSSWKYFFYYIQSKSLKHFYLGILNIFNWIKTMLIFQLELALLESACDFYQLESQH